MKITVRNVYTSGGCLSRQSIEVKDGVICGIKPFAGENFDYENLAPAFVDIHINGGENFHFTANPTEETLKDMEFSAYKNGVGYLLPALITSSEENIFQAISIVKSYIKINPNSSIFGLHLEGPFISEKKRGAHLSKYILHPEDRLLKQIIKEGEGVLKMITIAPENFSDSQIEMLLEAGIKVSLGHSNCSYKRAMEAFGLGVDLVTHLFNAMSPFQHRNPGLAAAALANDSVFTPIIPDGIHVDFDAAKLALKIKKEKLFFISDALFQNHVKQAFVWEEFDAKLINGDYINADGNLAGATISMADCFRNGVEILNLSLIESLEKCSSIPAETMKLKAGKIENGYEAKFVTFENSLKYLNFQ